MIDKLVNIKLILEFHSTPIGQLVAEWTEKKLLYNLYRLKKIKQVLSLCLTTETIGLSVAEQKSHIKKDAQQTAFAMDSFMADKQFIRYHLHPRRPANISLAELLKLAALFGGMSNQDMAFALSLISKSHQAAFVSIIQNE